MFGINYRIIFIGLIPLILFIYFGYEYTNKSVEVLQNQKYTEVSSEMKNQLRLFIEEKKEAILLIGSSLSQSQKIKDFLTSKDKEKLDLHKFSLELKENSSLRNVWFQVLTTKGVSVYRSWTDKKGDSLVKSRTNVAQIIKEPKITSSISTGKFDMTFKTMVPLYKNGVFIGIIETIAKFNSIAVKMQEKNYKILILVDKKYKKQLTKAFTKNFIEDYYVANLKPDKIILELVNTSKVKNFIDIENFHLYKEKDLLITNYKLKDIHSKDMGYFLLAYKLSDIDVSEIEDTKNKIILILSLIFISVGVMLYYFYIINYKNFIQRQNKILEAKVDFKTQELKNINRELQHQAEHDCLTSLPNRLLFIDRLNQALKYAARRKQNVGVLFLDLDRFKEINDVHGHDIGDELLKEVTKRLVKSVREEDTVARLGGDEFTIIIQNSDNKNIIKVADKIMQAMKNVFRINELELSTTFSIGISSFPQDGQTSEVLLRNADTAMYKAKDNGKNNYKFYNEQMTALALQRVELERDIKKALLNDEFEPYFQPKIDANTLEVLGLESLIRWKHPVKGMISPFEFIPFAEELGLITNIDNYMMRKSIQIVQKWQDDGIQTGVLSVNISTKHLEGEELINKIKEVVSSTGFNTSYLEIEITESQIMQNAQNAIDILNDIKQLGITISIDDFGTGYSSLSYLKKLPINKLKIDKSFIDDLPDDEDDVAIVKTIISLAKNLNLNIIAEGVETKEQVEFLVKNGCSNIQGYYYSKPLSEDDCKNFFINKNSILLLDLEIL